MNEQSSNQPSTTRRTIQPDDLFHMAFVQGGKLSPDGKTVVYAVMRTVQAPADHESEPSAESKDDPPKEEDKDVCALWLADRVTGEHRQLTAGTAFDSAPVWSPDGTRIAFLSNRADKKNQVYVIPIDGGEARPLTAFKNGIGGGLAWSPDGRWIAFTANPDQNPPKDNEPFRVTRSVFRFNGIGVIDRSKQDIYVISPADALDEPPDASRATRLTDDDAVNQNPIWSPDGTRLLYFKFMPPDSISPFPRMCLIPFEADSDGHRLSRDVLGEWGESFTAAWTHDNAQIVFLGKPAHSKIGSKPDVFIVPADGGTPENRTAKLHVMVGGGLQPDFPALALDDGSIYVTADFDAYLNVQEGGMVHIYRVSLRGVESWIAVAGGERSCAIQDLRAGNILFAASDLNSPPDLYTISINGTEERRLTRLNTGLFAQFALPAVEHLLFRSSDNALVEGWMLKPPVGDAPYPTVLYIHGGPHSGFGHTFSFDFHMLAGAGFGVLIVNHRGSTGYGDEFANAILNDWGNLDYEDLMAGVDHAINSGLADANRLGVCGLSGGGNLSCWIVGQTNRFKAAVPENPLTNWTSFYGVSDIGVWFGVNEMGGHPFQATETYWRCSPITYAHNCVTPTLLVQCEHDWRCPPEQSEQFYTTLKANDCIVEMLRIPNEPHAGAIGGSPKSRRAQNVALLGWMKKYVLG